MRPLYGRRRKRKAKPLTRTCLTPGCERICAAWKWICDVCFREIPGKKRSAICEARQQRAPHRVYGLSKDAADWLEAKRAKRPPQQGSTDT